MSTVKAANLQNTGSGAPAFKNSSGTEIGQLCKAWVNCVHDGTVSDSFNVSSVTDNGSADLTVNFTTAFANDDYCMTGGAIYSNGVGTGYGMPTIKEADSAGNPTTKTVSACRVETMHSQSSGNAVNTVQATNTQLQIYMVFHGS